MAETIKIELTENEARTLREFMAECAAGMKQAHEQMEKEQVEIDRLGAEIREILSRDWRTA